MALDAFVQTVNITPTADQLGSCTVVWSGVSRGRALIIVLAGPLAQSQHSGQPCVLSEVDLSFVRHILGTSTSTRLDDDHRYRAALAAGRKLVTRLRPRIEKVATELVWRGKLSGLELRAVLRG